GTPSSMTIAPTKRLALLRLTIRRYRTLSRGRIRRSWEESEIWMTGSSGVAGVAGDGVGARDRGVERAGGAQAALLGVLIEGIEAEAQLPPFGPLEVIHQRPEEHAAHVDPILDRPVRRREVAEEEARALVVVGIGDAGLGDIDWQAEPGDPTQRAVEPGR